MGMFDHVIGIPQLQCPKCGGPLGEWQSKDGPCEFAEVHFTHLRNFYTSCRACRAWVEFVDSDYARSDALTEPIPGRSLADYIQNPTTADGEPHDTGA